MAKRNLPVDRLAYAGLLALLCADPACSNSGQTGSPANAPPTYDVFTRFGPDSGGMGIDVGGPCADTNNPSLETWPTKFAKLHGDHLVVVAQPPWLPLYYGLPQTAPSRGLLIFDVSEPAEPALVGELPLAGAPLKLLVDDDFITIVMVERIDEDLDSLPVDPVPYAATRLLRIDWSDPTAPELASSMQLEEDFWGITKTADRYHLLTARWQSPEPVCRDSGGLMMVPESVEQCATGTLRVSTYAEDGAALVPDGLIDLGGDGYTGFAGPGGFVAVSGTGELEQTLHAARIDSADGSLVEIETIEVDGQVNAASLSDDQLAVVLNPAVGNAELRLYDVADPAQPTQMASVELPFWQPRATFLPDQAALLVEGNVETAGAVWVDLADPARPRVTELDGVSQAVFSGGNLVGAGADGDGRVALSLWHAEASSDPTRIATLQPGWLYSYTTDTSPPPWTFDPEAGWLLYPTHTGTSADWREQLGIARITDEAIAEVGRVETSGWAVRPLVRGENAYVIADDALEVVSLAEATPVQSLPFYEDPIRRVVDEVTVAGQTVKLVREGEVVAIEVAAPDRSDDVARFELSHFAEALAVDGDRVVALGLQRVPECTTATDADQLADMDCPVPNQAGITVLSLADEPQIEASILIPGDLDAPSLPDGATYRAEWYGYVALGAGRFLLPVRRGVRCDTLEACDELGIESEEGMASGGGDGCASDDPECGSEDTGGSFVTHTGSDFHEYAYLLYLDGPNGPELRGPERLDQGGDAGSSPRLELPGEGPLDLGAFVLVSGSTVGLTAYEYLPEAGGEGTLTNDHGDSLVRIWLNRIRVADDGRVEWTDSINTPGIPVALTDHGDTAFSVMPEYLDDDRIRALLHRLRLEDRGAYIEDTLPLGVGYRDGFSLGGRAFFVQGPEDPCDPEPKSRVFSVALDADALAKDDSLTIDGNDWSFAVFDSPWQPDTVLLRGGPCSYRGRLTLDVATAGAAPSIARYVCGAQ